MQTAIQQHGQTTQQSGSNRIIEQQKQKQGPINGTGRQIQVRQVETTKVTRAATAHRIVVTQQQLTIAAMHHQVRRVIIPLMGIHIIPSMRTIIPITRARTPDSIAPKDGSNPAMNALSINPSAQIHATYSGARRSVIGKARIPIAIPASRSPNVRQNPHHAIGTPIQQQDSTACSIPQYRAYTAVMSRSMQPHATIQRVIIGIVIISLP